MMGDVLRSFHFQRLHTSLRVGALDGSGGTPADYLTGDVLRVFHFQRLHTLLRVRAPNGPGGTPTYLTNLNGITESCRFDRFAKEAL